jgi:hypothetical protein
VASDTVASHRVLEHAGYELMKEAHGTLHDHHGFIRTYRCHG